MGYQKEKDAELAHNDFIEHYLPELSKELVAKVEDGTWTACQLSGNFLIIVFNAPTEDRALNLIEAVKERIVSESLKILDKGNKIGKIPELWDGHAADRIVSVLRKSL